MGGPNEPFLQTAVQKDFSEILFFWQELFFVNFSEANSRLNIHSEKNPFEQQFQCIRSLI